MKKFIALLTMGLLSASSVVANEISLGSCSGDDAERNAYVVSLTETSNDRKMWAQVHLEKGERVIPLGYKIEIFDDQFQDEENLTHNLVDRKADIDSRDKANIFISYNANGERSNVEAMVIILNAQGAKIELSDAVCDLSVQKMYN